MGLPECHQHDNRAHKQTQNLNGNFDPDTAVLLNGKTSSLVSVVIRKLTTLVIKEEPAAMEKRPLKSKGDGIKRCDTFTPSIGAICLKNFKQEASLQKIVGFFLGEERESLLITRGGSLLPHGTFLKSS